MKKIFLQKRLDIQVPDSVIQSIWNLYDLSQSSNYATYPIMIGTQYNGSMDCVVVTEFQKSISDKTSESKIPELPKRKVWICDNDDVKIIDAFIKKHFTSAFMFRVDKMYARTKLNWHKQHSFPKVFIPMHETVTEFMVKINNDESTLHSNKFELGSCWLWDVRQNHSVDNTKSDIDRFMACFCIDPYLETNTQIFV